MADLSPVARSPIRQAPPVTMVAGWEVSARQSTSPLRLIDCAPYTKTLVRTDPESPWALALGIDRGRAKRDAAGALVAAIGYGEWLIISPPGREPSLLATETSNGATPLTRVDLTHARAMIQITGAVSVRVLSKLCGIDFRDTANPDDCALRSSMARLVTEIIRHDVVQPRATGEPGPSTPSRSYLLLCDRSAGQYLFDVLLDAGREYGIDVEGVANIISTSSTST